MESEIGKSYVISIGEVLEKLVHLNEKYRQEVRRFESAVNFCNKLSRKVFSFINNLMMNRLEKYLYCSYECFVIALIYIDRIIERYDYVITPMNVHRLILACMRLATKFHEEDPYDNKYVSQVGGVKVHELNRIELEALFLLSFDLFVNIDDYERYYAYLGKKSKLFMSECSSSLSITSVLTSFSKERLPSGIISDQEVEIAEEN